MTKLLAQLCAFQTQLSDSPENMDNSLAIFDLLMSETYASNASVLSTEERLTWLSIVRSFIERKLPERTGHRIPVPVEGLTQKLKGLLKSVEDAFVVYEAQRVFVALMKWKNVEEGISLIQNVLETETFIETVTCYLEICSDLLSKQNPQCGLFLARTQSSLRHIVQAYIDGSYKLVTDQFLYQLIVIFFKMAKLASLYKSEETNKALTEVYLRNWSLFLDILFQTDVKRFIRRKLCLTLYYILKPASVAWEKGKEPNGIPMVETSDSNIVQLAETFLKKVLVIGFETVIWKFEQSDGFTGSEHYTGGSNNEVDYAHLREWSVLSIGMAVILHKALKDLDDLLMEFVMKLDSSVKERLGSKSAISFAWLPGVFADQDDMWIDALLMLIDLQPSVVADCLGLDHHWYFLQFVSTVAYDHLVLIDLLTSPETRFIDYLTKYLKYLLNTWTDFAATIVRFENFTEGNTDNIIENNVYVRESTASDKVKTFDDKEIKDNHIEDDENVKLSDEMIQGNDEEVDGIDFEGMEQEEDNNQFAMEIGREMPLGTESLTEVCVDRCKSSNVENKQSSEQEVKEGLISVANKDKAEDFVTVVKSTAGLAMLMGTYSDSEDEMEHDCCEKKLYKLEKGCSSTFHSESKQLKSLEKLSCTHEHECLERRLDTGGIEEDRIDKSDTDDDDDDAESEECEVETDESSVMDKTMGMLIRVQLKLQRMWKVQIITYDPKALLRLLEDAESLYAEAEK